jgi:phospholipase/carboxylesterase
VAETDRLAALLRSAGAQVSVHWHQAGHQLVHDDIERAHAWLARF